MLPIRESGFRVDEERPANFRAKIRVIGAVSGRLQIGRVHCHGVQIISRIKDLNIVIILIIQLSK
jgi:hypothetical protein